jgi:Dyp-type peroxidase family
MPDPIDSLDSPIDWRDPALWPILSDLQGNILKGHGRDHTQNIFLRFDPQRVADVRKAIRSVAANVTSALTQLRETSVFKIEGRPGGTAIFLAISAAGYRAIGLTPPGNPAFLEGMAARAADLHDPDATRWEDHLRGVHAVLIVADDSDTLVANAASFLTAGFAPGGITILGRDAGRALRRAPGTSHGKGEGIEHFGYVDGRSQPLLLAEDVATERTKEGPFIWDPGFSPRDAALVRDPHGAFGDSFGSYLVYRKLEQNVAGFQAQEDALANALGLVGQDRERAGAMVVGRFEDGSPLTKGKAAGAGAINNFDYATDGAGLRCPFLSHVRKANPRGDTKRRLGATKESERAHLMPRRGIPYGERADLPGLEGPFPSSGVGLLFMAYNADIARQFEFTQKSWANNPAFVDNALTGVPNTGIDPIIGEPPPGTAVQPQSWRASFDAPPSEPIAFAFADFVTMKGGEYLFAPSLSALAAL